MKKIIILPATLLLCSLFLTSCSDEESFENLNTKNEEVLKKEAIENERIIETEKNIFFENQEIFNSISNPQIKSIDVNSFPLFSKAIDNTSLDNNNLPWSEIKYLPAEKIKLNATSHPKGVSFTFLPEIASKYGLAPGTYWCDIYSIRGEVTLPSNVIAVDVPSQTPQGYIKFSPSENKETFGFDYNLSSGTPKVLKINTQVILIKTNWLQQNINRFIPINNSSLQIQYRTLAL
ncbi:hypothetical protein ACTS9V_17515 [Empedobacter falsenii]|uniref:hypothetical protein n=1 Tax=Weeksella virosa TaxID=1014 RepID=UPI00255217EB|nr:hypothetical protein [Weeksella virosa]MDK7376112.1 hypothetical protein [Weeksella virosa]